MRVSKPPHQRKAELVAAARQLFDQNGVENTRVSDIVGKVGVAQGVFYYYFKSKDEMVREVVRQVGEEVDEKSTSILNDGSLTFCQKLSGLIELVLGLVDQFLEDDAERLPENSFKSPSPAAQSVARLLNGLTTLVEQGAATGQVQTPYPAQTVRVLLAGFQGLAQRALPTREMIYAVAQQALGIPDDGLMQVYRSTVE